MADPENLEPPQKPEASLPMRLERDTGPLQIPPDVWKRLPVEQMIKYLNEAMEFNREMERKRFDQEVTEATRMNTANTRSVFVGVLVVLLSMAAIVYMAAINQPMVAIPMVTGLATLVATFIVRRR